YSVRPDATFLLDLPAETALGRLHGPKDRIEQEDISFFEDIAAAYRRLAAAEPNRFYVIDATCSIKEESDRINDILLRLLKAR
ncbi:MAG: dTMP kinase, partial [Firmicutes bacterium]|nr:dTMP kinase [Bacillota bacterium]